MHSMQHYPRSGRSHSGHVSLQLLRSWEVCIHHYETVRFLHARKVLTWRVGLLFGLSRRPGDDGNRRGFLFGLPSWE